MTPEVCLRTAQWSHIRLPIGITHRALGAQGQASTADQSAGSPGVRPNSPVLANLPSWTADTAGCKNTLHSGRSKFNPKSQENKTNQNKPQTPKAASEKSPQVV